MTQNEMIKDYLESGKELTPMDALNLFGCFRLGARIYDLKRNGMKIKSELREVRRADGTKARVSAYYV